MTDTTIIVCPDCGQRYDPAIERGEFRSRRGVGKKTRVAAQDVRTPGHRHGPHHALLACATRQVLAEWAPLATTDRSLHPPLLRTAQRVEATLVAHEHQANGSKASLWFVAADELEGVAIECGEGAPEFARRVLVACSAVRHGAPWWHAWMQANGVPGETIAQGYRVNRARRADVWLGLSMTEPREQSPTLRGLL